MLNKNANCYNIQKYVQWAYRNFPNTFNWYLTTQMSTTTSKYYKKWRIFFFCKVFRIIKFFFLMLITSNKWNKKLRTFFSANFSELLNFSSLILLIEATLESKVAPTNRNSSAFLSQTSNTFSDIEWFSIFSQTVIQQYWNLSTSCTLIHSYSLQRWFTEYRL